MLNTTDKRIVLKGIDEWARREKHKHYDVVSKIERHVSIHTKVKAAKLEKLRRVLNAEKDKLRKELTRELKRGHMFPDTAEIDNMASHLRFEIASAVTEEEQQEAVAHIRKYTHA